MIHEPGKIVYSFYEIVGLVGQGGMGAVYQARDLRDMSIVALKQMREDTTAGFDGQKMREKFEQEWQILKTLDHPRIPHMISAFAEGDSIYYVMEFIQGKSLAAKVRELKKQGKRFPEILLLEYAVQLLDVLEYLHARKPPVLHRDIKPENVIVRDENGEIVLVDFGLARGFGASAGQATQTQVGTLGFAPLEQVKGKPEIRSDIYGVGATMWYMLAGEVPPPFDIQPIEDMRNDLFPGISEVVNRACQSNVNRRFASASKMELALRQALANLQGVPLDRRAEELFVEEAPLQLSADATPAPMPAGIFLIQAALGVLVVMGGIFLLATVRDALNKDPGKAATPRPTSTMQAGTPPGTDATGAPFVPGLPGGDDYALTPDHTPLTVYPASTALRQSYQNWLGPGWELTRTAGSVGPNGAMDAEPQKSAALMFQTAKPVKLASLNLTLIRQGMSPGSVQLNLGSRDKPQAMIMLSTFTNGGYTQGVLQGRENPATFGLPRNPYESLMQLTMQFLPGQITLSAPAANQQATLSADIPAIEFIQILVPAANKKQRIVVTNMSLIGQ